MKLVGKVWKFGDNIDTDVIIPARYLSASTAEELGKHCMEDIDPSFVENVEPGQIMVAGENFGCGSSREHAPLALKGAGIACVIAKSYARIFYRNAIDIGLPILESAEAVDGAMTGDVLEVELETGTITNQRTGITYQAKPFPKFIMEIIEAGGLIPYTQRRLQAQKSAR